jgi:formiminotetrahydrofolate cyclodeaminase
MRKKITIDRYLDKLAARIPVPGGGSAAALVGAVGISLLSMVAKYTLKRNSKRAASNRLSRILEFTERTRLRLRELMKEDEAVYLNLSKALRKHQSKNKAKLYKDAAGVPFEVCILLQKGLKSCESLCSYCKTSLISDLAESALLLEAGFMSAKRNVEINLRGIKDLRYTKKIKKALRKHTAIVLKIKKRILRKIASI